MGSPVTFSVDGAATFHRANFNQSINRTWDSFVVYEGGTDDVWAHDFGTYVKDPSAGGYTTGFPGMFLRDSL